MRWGSEQGTVLFKENNQTEERKYMSTDRKVLVVTGASQAQEPLFVAFQKEFNMSPAHWIRSLRVEAARARLQSSSEGLKQIAASTGLRDELSLRRAFVAQFGISPRDYRQQVRGKYAHDPKGS
jgi:methylphosphotriester-DNA--protein-cysteine methyltransferase